jgi:hypothetical protein
MIDLLLHDTTGSIKRGLGIIVIYHNDDSKDKDLHSEKLMAVPVHVIIGAFICKDRQTV